MANDPNPTARQVAAQAIAASSACRATVQRLRDRAYEQFQSKQISVADYNKVDLACGKALAGALSIDEAAARGLSAELDAVLDPIGVATDQLRAAADAIEHAQDVVKLSASLLLSVLAVAAAVVDPTHASAAAAVSALVDTAQEIARQAGAKGDDDAAGAASEEDDDPKGDAA